MIVDSSALIALLKAEPEALRFAAYLAEKRGSAQLSAATYLEAGIVADRYLAAKDAARLDQIIAEFEIEITPVTVEHARIARQAYREFGKHSGHRARLNFGDCFAYALAKDSGEPLLFKGDDFSQTDIVAA